MKGSLLPLLVLALLLVPLGIYVYQKMQPTAHYYVIQGEQQSQGVDVGTGVVIPNPKLVVLLAEQPGCLYCEVVKEDLKKYPVMIKVFNMKDSYDRALFLSYLKQANLPYLGVPTALIGRMAFYSYLDSNTCPNGYVQETITIGKEKITLCALANQSRYYLYMPTVIGKIIEACLKYKEPVCFGP